MGLSREGLAVARALQRYGAYVVDRSGSFTLYVEHAGEGPAVDRIRADLDRIRSQLRVVANNGPSNVGGGGAPTQPLAPPLG
jgi:hypothetical protein